MLIISFIGYESQRLPVGAQRDFQVTLALDAKQLEEVVVTALGISREKKTRGYSVQDVDGSDIAQTNPFSWWMVHPL